MLCEFRRSDDPGRQNTGTGEAEHGDRVQKGGRSSLVVPWFASVGSRDCTKLDRRPQIPCITILTHSPYLVGANSCWRSKRWRCGVRRSDGQLLLAKQEMAMWGVPIRWPTPVGEARDGDVGCADPMAKQKMATWGVPIRWPTPVGEARDRDLFYANPMGLDTGTGKANTGTGESKHGDRVRRY